MSQGFADELFRVWLLKHPHTCFHVTGANDQILKMIRHIQSRADLPQPAAGSGQVDAFY